MWWFNAKFKSKCLERECISGKVNVIFTIVMNSQHNFRFC